MRIEVRTGGTASAHLGYAPDVGDWVLAELDRCGPPRPDLLPCHRPACAAS
jgi:hypothetical protein